jgi:hypothetical protein
VAHLGKVAVEQRRAPAEGGQLLGEDDLLAALGGFERRLLPGVPLPTTRIVWLVAMDADIEPPGNGNSC